MGIAKTRGFTIIETNDRIAEIYPIAGVGLARAPGAREKKTNKARDCSLLVAWRDVGAA